MLCSKCRHPAIIYQRYSGLHLCKAHFIADFESKAKRAIRNHRWIKPKDRIAVALSGGEESSALLYFLKKILGTRRDVSLFAISIDEGIKGYRDRRITANIAESIGVELITDSFDEVLGKTIDEVVREKGDRFSCIFCKGLQGLVLNQIANDHDITKLALGLNLDDEAKNLLVHIFRGDAERLLKPADSLFRVVPMIRPFLYIPAREVALYAYFNMGGFEIRRCPYSHNTLETDVHSLLNKYNWRHPSTKYALVNLGEHLVSYGVMPLTDAGICPDCGEPCHGEYQEWGMLRELHHV